MRWSYVYVVVTSSLSCIWLRVSIRYERDQKEVASQCIVVINREGIRCRVQSIYIAGPQGRS